MHPVRRRRLGYAALIVLGVAIAVAIALAAFRQNLMFFYSPTEVAAGEAPVDRSFRVGGLVAADSVEHSDDGLGVKFSVTDRREQLDVRFTGILPDLFREGQGVVAQGRLVDDGVFMADEVLAKHDENYMPPEVHDALEAGDAANAADAAEAARAAGGGSP